MIRILLHISLLLIGPFAIAQNFESAYNKAYQHFNGIQNVAYEVVYISKGHTQTLDQYVLKFEKVSGVLYNKVGETESYLLDSTKIVIDHSNKLVLLNTGLHSYDNQFQSIASVKNLIQLASKEEVFDKGDANCYALYFQDEKFDRIEMFVSSEKGEFKKMRYHLTDPIKEFEDDEREPLELVEIQFNNYKTNIEQLSTPLSTYLELKDKKYVLNKELSDYQFITNYYD